MKERDARIAKLESVLEELRRAGKRQAAPFSKDKPKRDPKKPERKPGSDPRRPPALRVDGIVQAPADVGAVQPGEPDVQAVLHPGPAQDLVVGR